MNRRLPDASQLCHNGEGPNVPTSSEALKVSSNWEIGKVHESKREKTCFIIAARPTRKRRKRGDFKGNDGRCGRSSRHFFNSAHRFIWSLKMTSGLWYRGSHWCLFNEFFPLFSFFPHCDVHHLRHFHAQPMHNIYFPIKWSRPADQAAVILLNRFVAPWPKAQAQGTRRIQIHLDSRWKLESLIAGLTSRGSSPSWTLVFASRGTWTRLKVIYFSSVKIGNGINCFIFFLTLQLEGKR